MSHFAKELGIESIQAGASVLSRPAEEFGNDSTVEAMWAIKAYEHGEIYFNILCSVDPKILKLTPHDDLILKTFYEEFPDTKLEHLNENELKSIENKVKWRVFCEKFKDTVEDYSFGTLLRLNCKGEYSEDNTTLVPRIQFYAIELARNRQGLNNGIREKFSNKRKIKK